MRPLRLGFGPLAAGALMIAASVLPPRPAQAQINPFRSYSGPVLTREDRAAGQQAAARLLDAPSPQVGDWETWSGPASGNTGILTIERIYRRNGLDCRAVRSTVQFRAGTERSLLLQACKSGGRWRLAS